MSSWKLRKEISDELKSKYVEYDPIILQLLVNRGLFGQNAGRDDIDSIKVEISKFINPEWSQHVHDPFEFRDMAKAVERIFQAIKVQEKITIFGDYDADGVCGSVLLYKTLGRLGAKNISVYIPHREQEGYGLNEKAVRQIINEGTSLIISVDLGISNTIEVALANELGAQVIIVDHHDLVDRGSGKEVPLAYAIIHADIPGEKYPFKDLCGAGTAFKLAQGLLQHSLEPVEAFEKWLLDLVSIATIGDMVPLFGENRVFVKYGLIVLQKTQRIGLQALLSKSSLEGKLLTAWNVAFQIVPRINAAGRVSHAREALFLLLAEELQEAERLADHLNTINRERQNLGHEISKQAIEQIGEVGPDDYLLVACNHTWALGLVGLVAGRIAKKFYRPVVLITKTSEHLSGSGRSIEGFDITEALGMVKSNLLKFGGHPGACGLSLNEDKYEEFVRDLKSVARVKLAGSDLTQTLNIDVEVEIEKVTNDLVEYILKLEPYGMGNEEPVFVSKRLQVVSVSSVGADDQHLRINVKADTGNAHKKCIGFGLAKEWLSKIKVGEHIDIVYNIGFNVWNGSRELQIKLKDLRKSYS